MKYFWICFVVGGKVGSLNLTVVLCELKGKGSWKVLFWIKPMFW